jgi:hypothetical protein
MDISSLPQWPGDPNKREPPDKPPLSYDPVTAGLLLFLCGIVLMGCFFWLACTAGSFVLPM